MKKFDISKYWAFFILPTDEKDLKKEKEKAEKILWKKFDKFKFFNNYVLVPSITFEQFKKDYEDFNKKEIKEELDKLGKRKIIKQELLNYECYFSENIDEVVSNLKEYWITKKEIIKVFQENYDKYC